MIPNLPLWYRVAAIDNISAETLEKRSAAIEDLLDNELQFYFDCVRLYLGKKVANKNFEKEFFNRFNAKDSLYLEDAGNLEKRILSGAIISKCFSSEHKYADRLAYALLCGRFGINDATLINRDIIDSAYTYLQSKAISERTSSSTSKPPIFKEDLPKPADSVIAYLKALTDYAKGIATYTDKQSKHNQKQINRLQEESDIHWWIFRSFSNLKSIPISELSPNQAIFILAYELSELLMVTPALDNTCSFLNKNLKEVHNLPIEISIKDAAENLAELNNLFGNISENDTCGDLVPLVYALKQRIIAGGDDVWASIFKLQAQIDPNFMSSPQQMALQFFNELVLLRIA